MSRNYKSCLAEGINDAVRRENHPSWKNNEQEYQYRWPTQGMNKRVQRSSLRAGYLNLMSASLLFSQLVLMSKAKRRDPCQHSVTTSTSSHNRVTTFQSNACSFSADILEHLSSAQTALVICNLSLQLIQLR